MENSKIWKRKTKCMEIDWNILKKIEIIKTSRQILKIYGNIGLFLVYGYVSPLLENHMFGQTDRGRGGPGRRGNLQMTTNKSQKLIRLCGPQQYT